MLTSNWLTVVQGLIISPDKKRVLMQFRPPNKKKPLMWEYPGGKVEPSDPTLMDALKRELKEELDIEVEVGPRIAKTTFLWKENVELYLFAVERWIGEPKPLVATELRWVDPEYAIDYMPCLPGAFATYREVTSYLKSLS